MKSRITKNHFILTSLIVLIFILNCPIITNEKDDDKEKVIRTAVTLTYSGTNDEIFHVDNGAATAVDLTVDLGSYTRDIYYIFTNTSINTQYSNPQISSVFDDNFLLNTIKSDKNLINKSAIKSKDAVIYEKKEIQEFNKNSPKFLKKTK